MNKAEVRSHSEPISSAAIIGDKNCIYCGTSLRGLSAQDACPKCGKPAGYSLLGDHLRDAESTWTQSIVRGIGVSVIAYATLVAAITVNILSLVDPKNIIIESSLFRFILALAGWIVFLVGVVYLTPAETSESLLARRRGVAISLLLSTIIRIPMAFTPKHWILEVSNANTVLAVSVIAALMLVISQSTLWIHLRRVIDRTPRREVGKLLNLGFWASLLLFVLFNDCTSIVMDRLHLPPQTQFAILLSLNGLAILQRIGAIYLLISTRKAIRRTVGYWDN